MRSEETFSPDQIDFFESKIRPVLAENCFECHKGTKAKNGLHLTSRASIMRGTDYKKIIDLEQPEKSALIVAISHSGSADLQMPKDGEKLPDEVIADFQKWVAMKLPWPIDEAVDVSVDPKTHWSFQPVIKPSLPEGFSGNPIDHFISQKIAEVGLVSAEKADRYTRYRRLHFDLLG